MDMTVKVVIIERSKEKDSKIILCRTEYDLNVDSFLNDIMKGYITMSTEEEFPLHESVTLKLARNWDNLSEKQLKKIKRVCENKEKSPTL